MLGLCEMSDPNIFKLRIVLEHCTTAAAIAAVKECGPNVVGTITVSDISLMKFMV